MWLWRVFESAFVRKIAYLLAGLLLAMLLGHRSHAQGAQCYNYAVVTWSLGGSGGSGFSRPDGFDAVCGSVTSSSQFDNSTNSYTCSNCSAWPPSGGSGGQGSCDIALNGTNIGTMFMSYTATPTTCPQTCSSPTGTYDIQPPGYVQQAEGSTACGSDGCQYIMGPASSFRSFSAGPNRAAQTATNTGTGCAAAPGQAAIPGSQIDTGKPVLDCELSGGVDACVTQNPAGQWCGQYNGDDICVSAIKPGTCESFPSGGVACVAGPSASGVTAPPGPDNGTPGVPATPDAVESVSVSGVTASALYFTAGTVSRSASGVNTQGAGSTGNGSGASGSGSGSSGTGTCDSSGGSGVSNCDCTAGPICGDVASGAADCSGPPSCSGDTVLCTSLMNAYAARCPSDTASGIHAVLAADGSPSAVWASSVDVSSALSETSGPFTTNLGVACPAPLSVTVFGNMLSFDFFAQMCNWARAVSWVILAVAWVVAGRIMIGGMVQKGV